jgi:hypothetical protein
MPGSLYDISEDDAKTALKGRGVLSSAKYDCSHARIIPDLGYALSRYVRPLY